MKTLRVSGVTLGIKVVIVLLACSTLAGCSSYSVGVDDPRSAGNAKNPSSSQPAQAALATPLLQKPVDNKPSANPSVRVCSPSAHGDPCEPIANIYSDSSLTIPKTSTDTDDNGNFSFYAKPGMYNLQITGGDSSSQLVPVAVLPTSGTPTPSNVTVARGGIFSFNLSGNLVVSGTITGQQGVTVGSPTGAAPSPPSAGSVTLFTGTNGQLYSENSSGQILGLATALPAGSPMQYVAFTGDDKNDGLSWGTAKKTVMAGYDALPINGGTILIMQGPGTFDGIAATSTPGQGIWIMPTTDPNYSNPPPGWRHAKAGPVTFQGVSATSSAADSHFGGQVSISGGSILSNNQPCIWIAGGSNYLFENLDCEGGGRGIVLGESSTNLRDGSANVTGITFANVATASRGTYLEGPAVDITGGSFWLYFRDCVFNGNSRVVSPLDNIHAAMLIDGTGNSGNGLIFVDNLNTTNGGIKFIPGANGGNLTVNGMTEEGGGGGTTPPAIYLTSTSSYTSFNFQSITVSDPDQSGPIAIQIDGNGPAQAVLITGNVGSAGSVVGPATILGQYTNDLISAPVSPAQMGQVGIFNGHLVGSTDAARRNFGPVAIRYPNLVTQVAANWTVTQFAGTTTLTTGIAAPDGTKGAGRVTSTALLPQEVLYFSNGRFPLNTGDYFIGGAWIRSLSPSGGYSGAPTVAITFQASDFGKGNSYSLSGRVTGALSSGQNEWTWQSFIFKIVGGVLTDPAITFAAYFDQNYPIEAYAPVMLQIPAGDVSDNEAYEIASNLSTYADGLPAGTVATLRGQTFAFGGTGNFFGLLSQSNTANRTYIFPDASGHVALIDNPQIWAATQTFDSVNLVNPTIDGETMSHAPIAIFPAFLPGALTSFYTAATFTPEHGILVTGVEISAKTAPQSCAVNAVIQVTGSNVAQVTLSSSQSDSGPLTVLMDGGTPIKIVLVPAQTCSVVPQDLNVTVRYRMQ